MHIERVSPQQVAPDAYKAVLGVEAQIQRSGLPKSLIELVKMRASQINGCAFCLDMHSKDALAAGETAQRLFLLNAWAEAPVFTPAERAALAWTDALTKVSETHAPDAAYEALKPHFSDKAIVDLTMLIGMINLWNRLAIGMRYVPDAA
ncbi:MAG TPA: carboxymuconolactone decarboxylase family protein [Rhodopila sp.]|uniref:carboxymuconolactone decarboxylase family protein n=1 Tax=Rhodopila sp. TaxID=2480087 RepID=UPI002B92516D|nr:carboxymuconolactone decarboxylase family protein [Rhodopila sp.]HVY15229.1 carboxymuconolactone decarboxylase family protein [Rhodopila sp.]